MQERERVSPSPSTLIALLPFPRRSSLLVPSRSLPASFVAVVAIVVVVVVGHLLSSARWWSFFFLFRLFLLSCPSLVRSPSQRRHCEGVHRIISICVFSSGSDRPWIAVIVVVSIIPSQPHSSVGSEVSSRSSSQPASHPDPFAFSRDTGVWHRSKRRPKATARRARRSSRPNVRSATASPNLKATSKVCGCDEFKDDVIRSRVM